MGSAPELCKGVHQKACDLEGVKGAAPPKHPLLKTMTTTTFKPSVQFLEAGEKVQEFTNAANTFKPFLPQEAQQAVEGVDKIANALNSTGEALKHFGFDEADEDELVGAKASDIVKGIGVGITTTGGAISTYSAASTPVTTIGGVAGTVVGGGVAAVGGVTAFTGFVLGWCGLDVDESEGDLLTGMKTNDENVGGMYNRVTGTGGTLITESSYNGEKVSDQLANVDEQQNAQFDAVTGYALNNDDAASFDWFQMHHDDGIMDGYLDTAETANGDMIITEFPEFLPGQTITLDESGMDGLVAAGPFDAVTLNEPQNNNVF